MIAPTIPDRVAGIAAAQRNVVPAQAPALLTEARTTSWTAKGEQGTGRGQGPVGSMAGEIDGPTRPPLSFNHQDIEREFIAPCARNQELACEDPLGVPQPYAYITGALRDLLRSSRLYL